MFQVNPLLEKSSLFSSKDKSKKKIKYRLLQFLFGALRDKGNRSARSNIMP